MKKLAFIWILLCLIASPLWGGNKITTTDVNKLPTQARDFISIHFSNSRISTIQIDKELLEPSDTSYDVLLENGYTLEFDRRGAWTEIKGNGNDLPLSVIPTKIRYYVEKHYANIKIISLDRDNRTCEAKLANKTELKFNKKGNLIEQDID